MADLEELTSKGPPSAATALNCFQSGVLDRAVCTAIEFGGLKVPKHRRSGVRCVRCRPSPRRLGTRGVGAKRQPQVQQEHPWRH